MITETLTEMTDAEKSAKITELNDKARQNLSNYSFTQCVRGLNREQLQRFA